MIKHQPFIKSTRTLIPWGYTVRLELHAEIEAPEELTAIADSLAQTVLAPCLAASSLVDVRGRTDGELMLSSDIPHRGEELCVFAGTVIGSGAAARREQDNPFIARLLTRFQDFLEPHHIRHTVHSEHEGSVPKELSVKDIPRAIPIELNYLRCGLECFHSRRFSGLLGFAPTVWATILLECTSTTLQLQATLEGQRTPEWRPHTLPELARRLINSV